MGYLVASGWIPSEIFRLALSLAEGGAEADAIREVLEKESCTVCVHPLHRTFLADLGECEACGQNLICTPGCHICPNGCEGAGW